MEQESHRDPIYNQMTSADQLNEKSQALAQL